MAAEVGQELSEEERIVEAAALAALAGVNPVWFLHCDDPLELATLNNVASRAHELRAEERQDLAVRIANAVWGAVNGD